jgi:glycosyltransferase 2 family protein
MVSPEPKVNYLRQVIRPLVIIIPLAIACNFIYILAVSRADLFEFLHQINILYLSVAIIMAFIPWLTHSIRTALWARAFNRQLSITDGLKVAIATELGSAVTPTSTGGGYVKMALLAAYGFNIGQAAMVTVLGSIEDAAFFIIAIPLAIYLSNSMDNPNLQKSIENIAGKWPWILGLAAVIVLIYAALILWRKNHKSINDTSDESGWLARLFRILSKLRKDFKLALRFAIGNGKVIFLLCTTLTGIGWICRYGAISAIAAGLGLPTDPILYFLLQWVVFTTMTVVPTPGAVGGAEASFAIVYSGIIPSGIMPIVIGVWRLVTFYLLVAAGGIILSIKKLDFAVGKPIGAIEEINK